MPPPDIGNPLRTVSRDDAGSVRSTIIPLRRNSEGTSFGEKMAGGAPSHARAGVPIPGRKRSGSSKSNFDGSEKLLTSGWMAGKGFDFDSSRITLPFPMGSSPPRSPPANRLSRRPSDASTTVIGDGSLSSSPPTQRMSACDTARPSHTRKPSVDHLGRGPCPPQSRQMNEAPDSSTKNKRVFGGSWSMDMDGSSEADSLLGESISPKQNGSARVTSHLTATRPTPRVDTLRAPRVYLSPLAQSPIRWSASGGESPDDASSRISLAVSSLAPSRRGSIAPNVGKVEDNLFPVFHSYYKLHGVVCRRELSHLSQEANTYLKRLVEAEQLVAGSAGSASYTSVYDTAMKALAFSRQLMSSYFDTIAIRAENEDRDRVLALGYQLMEMTMSNFRNVLQTVEQEKESTEPTTINPEMDSSTVATVGHDDELSSTSKLLSANKPLNMKKPSLFDRLRKVSLGCINVLDISSLPPTPIAIASRGPFRDSGMTVETRTLRESSIYTPTLASEVLGWDHMFLSPVTSDGSHQSLSVRASMALFPDDISQRPDLSPVDEEEFDVVRGKDGTIVKATVRGLVRVFTEPKEMVKNDMADLIDAFFLFWSRFTTAQDLYELLLAREGEAPPRRLSESKLTAWKLNHDLTRIHVANLICLWLESHWSNALDKQIEENLIKQIGGLCGRLSADNDVPVEIAHQLIDSIRKRGSWADKEKERTEDNIATDVCSEPLFRANLDQIISSLTRPDDWNALDITYFHEDGGPEVIARQLTVIEAEFFHSFQPAELINFDDREIQQKLQEWRSFSDALTLWVIKSIVEHNDMDLRTRAATVFVSAAAVCKSMRNYSSALAIILGLTSSPVTRLHQTEDSILRCFKDMRTELDEFFHKRSNFGEYRSELPVNLPTVPLEVVIIKDIKVSREVLPRVKSTVQPPVAPSEEMIPLQYYRNLRRTIRDLEKCRGEYKTLKKVGMVYDWLKHNTNTLKSKKYDTYINELTQMSVKAEPKTSSQGLPKL